jgi:hypothetical protein
MAFQNPLFLMKGGRKYVNPPNRKVCFSVTLSQYLLMYSPPPPFVYVYLGMLKTSKSIKISSTIFFLYLNTFSPYVYNKVRTSLQIYNRTVNYLCVKFNNCRACDCLEKCTSIISTFAIINIAKMGLTASP